MLRFARIAAPLAALALLTFASPALAHDSRLDNLQAAEANAYDAFAGCTTTPACERALLAIPHTATAFSVRLRDRIRNANPNAACMRATSGYVRAVQPVLRALHQTIGQPPGWSSRSLHAKALILGPTQALIVAMEPTVEAC